MLFLVQTSSGPSPNMLTPAPDHRQSAWTDRDLIQTTPLAFDLETDVCVIGGGIAGLLIAHRLFEEARRVIILDAGPIGGGETYVTTAHATATLDDRFTTIERLHGGDGVVASGLKHLAVYKDEGNQCTRMSAVCPHLGGLVRWNALEKTWDCPCHASRFDRTGRVIHGPANRNLPLADEA